MSPGPVDPLVEDAATALGGTPGAHAHPVRRLTALLVCLAVTTLAMALGAATRTECASGAWWQSRQFANLCYSDLPHQYVGLGLAEQVGPLDDGGGRWPDPAVTAPTALVAFAVARASQALFGVADPVDRNDAPATEVASDPQVRSEAVRYTAVAAVLLTAAALLSTAMLAMTARGRPWEAMGFAAAPVLVLSGVIGWDLLPVACVCAAMAAWTRDRPVLTGVLVGVGAGFALWPVALLVGVVLTAVRGGRVGRSAPAIAGAVMTWFGLNAVAYVLRPDGWLSYWDRHLDAAPGLGSLWRVTEELGLAGDASLANQVQFIGVVVVVAVVVWVAVTAPAVPRVSQLALLSVVGLLLVSKAVPVQAALWVLPFAVLARPRWRDLLIWQACEALYFCATWWHLGGYTSSGDGHDPIYPLAVLVRTVGLLWLVAMVVRDVRQPWLAPYGGSAGHRQVWPTGAV